MTLETLVLESPCAFSPRETHFNAAFWQGLADGEFRCTECTQCNRLSFPPKSICPACHSGTQSWRALSGRGIIYSVSTVHAVAPALASDGPVRVAVIDLDEGVRLVSRLLDPACELAIDDIVELVITQHSDQQLFFAARRAQAKD